MRHRARWIALAAGAVVAVLAVVLATQVGTDPRADANKSHLLGQNAPSLDLPTLDGGRVRSSDLAVRKSTRPWSSSSAATPRTRASPWSASCVTTPRARSVAT